VIANDFNCNVRTIERLRVRCNATNSTNDRPRCGIPHVTTARQNRLMVRQQAGDSSVLQHQIKITQAEIPFKCG
jgi:hypothetical protein